MLELLIFGALIAGFLITVSVAIHGDEKYGVFAIISGVAVAIVGYVTAEYKMFILGVAMVVLGFGPVASVAIAKAMKGEEE